MGKIIHGFDGWTGLQMREEDVWGSDAGAGAWVDVPFLGETFKPVLDFSPPSPEFGEIGAEKTSDFLNPRVEGELRVQARLDAPWFGILMAHVFGEEKLRADKYVDETAAVGCNSHWFLMNNTSRSLQFRVFKSGPDNGGYFAHFKGMQVTSWRLEWAEGGLPEFTFAFLGSTETDTDITAETLGLPVGDITTSQRWLSNTEGGFMIGVAPAEIEISSLSLSVDRQVNFDRSYLTSLATVNQPGPTRNRVVTCDITALLDQDFAIAGRPYYEYLTKAASSARINFRDQATIIAAKYYPLLIDFPNVAWTAASASIQEGGANVMEASFKALEGSTAGRIFDTGRTEIRAAMAMTIAEDADTYLAAQVVQS